MAKDKKEQEEGKKSGKLKLIIILLVALGLLGGGGFFAYKKFFSSKKEKPKVEQKETKEQENKNKKGEQKGKGEQEQISNLETKLVQLPTILVNLSDPLGKRYLKISIEIEVKDKDPTPLVEKKMPMIKDALILLLSSKTYDDLASLEKKYKLKLEIAQRLNQIFEKPIVTKVFFTEFLVQ
jgi:flagellar FliL protein